MGTHYDTLQVVPHADQEVVDAAGRALVKKYHPDSGGDKSLSAEILQARSIIGNARKRKEYDEELRRKYKKVIGQYGLIEKMAEGGFGVVYKAKHIVLDELTVIKHNLKISKTDTDLFKKEARAIWDLRHHAIPAIRDFFVLEDGSCCLVMSYIPGPTLQEVIDKLHTAKKEIDYEAVCWILERILDALRYIHYHGVVHGDIKPLNIIVQSDKHTCYLVDFGLASIRPDRKSRADGYTPIFAPPEALKEKPLLPESDLYSLGIVAIYALGGDPVKRRIPSAVPEPIRNFIEKLIPHDPNNRPHWNKTDIMQEFREIRIKVFGRAHTNFKKLEV